MRLWFTAFAVTMIQAVSVSAAEELAEHGEHAANGGLPQFDASWFPSQIFWLAVTFVILYNFFGRIILPRIAGTLEDRQRKLQDDMKAAENLTTQAKVIREDYEAVMNKARGRAAESLKDMEAKIKEKTNDQLYSFRTKYTAEISRAEADLTRERERLVGELNNIAAETAAHAASTILQTPADLEQAQQVVETLQRAKAA